MAEEETEGKEYTYNPVKDYLTQSELDDVNTALYRMEHYKKIGDIPLKKRLAALIEKISGRRLPDFNEDSSLIRDNELVNPFRDPDPDNEFSRKTGIPTAKNNGAQTDHCRQMVNQRYEQLKKYFGVKDERVQDMFYNIIEGTVTNDEYAWIFWYLDRQEEYMDEIDNYQGQQTEYTKQMRDWIAKERALRQAEQQAGQKRKSPAPPYPMPSQANRPAAKPPPEHGRLVNAGTERFE